MGYDVATRTLTTEGYDGGGQPDRLVLTWWVESQDETTNTSVIK